MSKKLYLTDTGTAILDEYIRGNKGLARALDKSETTIDRWDALGKLPPVTKLGKENLYRVDDVKDWNQARRVGVDLPSVANQIWTKQREQSKQANGVSDAEPKLGHNRRKIRIIRPWELEDQPDREPLIEDWQDKRSYCSLIGASNSGKSLILVHKATHVALGREWCGKEVAQGAVIYICGEGAEGLRARFQGYWRKHTIEPRECPVDIVQDYLDLVHGTHDLDALIEAIESLGHVRIALIIIDTASTVLGGESEDAKWFGTLNNRCNKLRDHFDCAVEIVHHLGKDESKGARGSTALLGNIDSEFTVRQPHPNCVELTDTKQRDRQKGRVLRFRIDEYKYTSAHGREMAVPTIEYAAERTQAPQAPRQSRLRGKKRIAYKAAVDVCNEHQLQAPISPHVPQYVRGATEDQWRNLCYARGITNGQSESAKRGAFFRLKSDLVAEQRVCLHEGFIWVPKDRFQELDSEVERSE